MVFLQATVVTVVDGSQRLRKMNNGDTQPNRLKESTTVSVRDPPKTNNAKKPEDKNDKNEKAESEAQTPNNLYLTADKINKPEEIMQVTEVDVLRTEGRTDEMENEKQISDNDMQRPPDIIGEVNEEVPLSADKVQMAEEIEKPESVDKMQQSCNKSKDSRNEVKLKLKSNTAGQLVLHRRKKMPQSFQDMPRRKNDSLVINPASLVARMALSTVGKEVCL